MAQRIINMFDCNNTNANSGMQSCPFDVKEMSGIIAIPAGTKITPTMQLALETTIFDGINNDNPALRWYPIQDMWQVEDKSTESQTETSAFGKINYLADGVPAFDFQHKNGVTMNKIYRKLLHGQEDRFSFVFIDKKNQALIGWSDSENNLYGFTLNSLSVPTWKIPTGTNGTAMYMISISLADSTEWNDNISAVKLPLTLQANKIKGLMQVELVNATDTFSTGTATIQVLSATTNLYDVYGADLADTSIWKAYNYATGGQITITTATADTELKGVELALNTSDPDYPASAGGKILVKFGNVTALIAADLPGISEAELVTTRS